MTDAIRLRLVLALAGALYGVSIQLLFFEQALAGAPVSAHRFALYAVVVFFAAFGLMSGPLPPARAAVAAAGLAGTAALLGMLAGLRFAPAPEFWTVADPTRAGLMAAPLLAGAALALPFVIAGCQDRARWRDYRRLFDIAWSAAVKSAVALAFLGLFWMAYFLSNALLELTGIDALEAFADTGWGAWMLSGIVLGLSLAVSCEMEGVIRTLRQLALRLLRLLLVPVTGVMVLFLLAALVQGPDEVFRGFSAAATMMAMAAGAVTLIAAVLGHGDEEAATAPLLIWSTRILAATLPLIAAVAVYAIWLRVAQYGWTPERLLALLIAGLVVAYAIPPAVLAVPARPGWQDGVRRGFVWVAFAAIGLAVLWQTPLLNAQRIAANSQLALLRAGRVEAATYDFWPMAREWGRPGRAAVDRLRAADPGPAVVARIDAALRTDSRHAARADTEAVRKAAAWDRVIGDVPTRPPGSALPRSDGLARGVIGRVDTANLRDACDRPVESGPRRCLAVQIDLLTANAGPEWLLIWQSSHGWTQVILLALNGAGQWARADIDENFYRDDDTDLIAALASGAYQVFVPGLRGIRIGDNVILPRGSEVLTRNRTEGTPQ